MERREFLKVAAASAAWLTLGREAYAQQRPGGGNPAKLPRRPYGKTGVELSTIGLGGIVVSGAEQDHADRVVAEAVERGINYFDVAPTYGDAEAKLGPALEPYRKNVFLACKTTQRQAQAAAEEFERSLERLRTDHFDLYQLHAITDVAKDVDAAFADGGVMPYLMEQRRAGRVRFLGFSAHSVAAALAALDRFDFDSILFPINFAAWLRGDFGPQVVERARARGAAVLALKAMAKQRWPSRDHPDRGKYPKCWYEPLAERQEAELGLRFTLGQPITAAIPPGDEGLWRLAVELAPGLSALNAAELEQLNHRAQALDPIFTNA